VGWAVRVALHPCIPSVFLSVGMAQFPVIDSSSSTVFGLQLSIYYLEEYTPSREATGRLR
jgi:hypothetical protein